MDDEPVCEWSVDVSEHNKKHESSKAMGKEVKEE